VIEEYRYRAELSGAEFVILPEVGRYSTTNSENMIFGEDDIPQLPSGGMGI
jgi:hypothetical protein